jgi:glycerol-3-phosphate dehydrogenase (NAD(P)+)
VASGGRITILQAGSWGTTLAVVLARAGRQVTLWARDQAQVSDMASRRENARYLPGVRIPDSVDITASLEKAVRASDHLVITVPSHGVRALLARMAPHVEPRHLVLSATKGIEAESGQRTSEIIAEVLPRTRLAVLSGPNIAREVASGMPTPTVVASPFDEVSRAFQDLVGTPTLRVYRNDDVIGVELAGALKNVIALGAGAIDGMKYGDNAKAGFITRGLAEIARLGVAAGANPLTFAGLAGFGDLVATSFSKHSRNRTAGELLAQGRSLADIGKALGGQVTEGVGTTLAARRLAMKHGVEMPICQSTYEVLFENKPIRDALRDLMAREQTEELSGALADLAKVLSQVASLARSLR